MKKALKLLTILLLVCLALGGCGSADGEQEGSANSTISVENDYFVWTSDEFQEWFNNNYEYRIEQFTTISTNGHPTQHTAKVNDVIKVSLLCDPKTDYIKMVIYETDYTPSRALATEAAVNAIQLMSVFNEPQQDMDTVLKYISSVHDDIEREIYKNNSDNIVYAFEVKNNISTFSAMPY